MSLTVGELEQALFDAFPRDDAEGWDQPGLSVGDRSQQVTGVALNLDQTAQAVIAADQAGCNVLVTHHPPFIKGGPTEFAPQGQASATGPGRLVYEAARRGISVITMHTNADRAIQLREKFADMLGMECLGNFEHLMDDGRSLYDTGFGALLEAPQGMTLEDLARRCADAFGGCPRVWGEHDAPLARIAVLNGSWGESEVYDICAAEGIECVIVGETRYHFCVDARPHLAVIDLGHDRSELPIVGLLADVVKAAGVPEEDIKTLTCSAGNWWTL